MADTSNEIEVEYPYEYYLLRAEVMGELITINQNTERLHKLIKRIKEFSKMSTTPPTLDQAVNDLTSAVGTYTTTVGEATSAISTLLSDIASQPSGADVSQQIANIEAQVALINQGNAALTAAIPSTTTPPVTGV